MIWWTGLAPWEFEFPFPGNLTSTLRRYDVREVAALSGASQEALAALPPSADLKLPPVLKLTVDHPADEAPVE